MFNACSGKTIKAIKRVIACMSSIFIIPSTLCGLGTSDKIAVKVSLPGELEGFLI